MKDSYLAGKYDVIVVGGGHAGAEAALASARRGANTLLLTMSPESIALMPCNPSVGGAAKGTLVREIDALGGAMACVTDRTQIQIRELNTGKGPAVRALRAQVDKLDYGRTMRRVLEGAENLSIRQGECASLILKGGRVRGVRMVTGPKIEAGAVVIAAGTYLRGRVIIGDYAFASGPMGHMPSLALARHLKSLGLLTARFKTGTPARVDRHSLDFSRMTEQPGSSEGLRFSFLTSRAAALKRPRIPCYMTYTSESTHDIIRRNLHRSPLYTGKIEGVGARYCPSIEDKVQRFPERDSHQLFLEPEGLAGREYYVQGMSSSLPEEVQTAFLRTIEGMRQVRLIRPAYAIEYDCIDPTALRATLELKEIGGLFFAGQINGTSGYEEAAAQGLVAGANAAAAAISLAPLVLNRADAMIGVMIDDLTAKGVLEPYRLFTALSEYRLLQRHDNADTRLCGIAYGAGLIKRGRYDRAKKKIRAVQTEISLLESFRPSAGSVAEAGFEYRQGITLSALLRRPGVSYEDIAPLSPSPNTDPEVRYQAEVAVKYAGYIAKQEALARKFKRAEHVRLPENLDYAAIGGLSREAAQKLARFRPDSVGMAGRISGVSPADINVLLVFLMARGAIQLSGPAG